MSGRQAGPQACLGVSMYARAGKRGRVYRSAVRVRVCGISRRPPSSRNGDFVVNLYPLFLPYDNSDASSDEEDLAV